VPLIVGKNAYTTLELADAYFEDRFDADKWASVSDTDKEKALITATAMLEELEWVGTSQSGQSLSFPRNGVYYNKKTGLDEYLQDEVPVCVVNATCELAYHLVANPGVLNPDTVPPRIKVDVIDIVAAPRIPRIPRHIRQMVSHLLRPQREFWIPR
jgi:hypothetical protein